MLHSLFLLITAGFTFFWHNNPELSKFSLQLAALLLTIFLFHNLLGRHNSQNKSFIKYQNISNSLIITCLCLLLILDTGGLASPLFFTLDFLLFGLSLWFAPNLGLLTGLALTLLWLLNIASLNWTNLANLVSLLLMAPLASFFGTSYLRLLEGQKQIKVLKYQSDQLKKQLSKEEGNTLIWLTLNFHQQITQALDLTSQIYSQLSTIPYHQREKLKTIYFDLKELFKSGEELKTKIDRLSDEN
ncbi:MAG: hypothetical protein V1810_01820 [Candidatus Beckwithbacteria bacterium]